MVSAQLTPTLRTLKANIHAGDKTIQVMHQTVNKFFLDPNGQVAKSEFKICKKDAHLCIAMTCIRYLMLWAANTTPTERLPEVKSWTSGQFEAYVQYLDRWPLADYALCYLKHHMEGCDQDANILDIASRFNHDLARSPAAYLLESWVRVHLNKTVLSRQHAAAAEVFRNNVLHVAVRKGFLTAAKVLSAIGANINARDWDGRSPLSRAAEEGHKAVVNLLLARNDVEVNSKDKLGQTPLSHAAKEGHEAVVQLLLTREDVDFNSKDKFGQTPLSWAAREGHEAVVKLLLGRDHVEANSKDSQGRTPLSWAAGEGQEAVVELLLERDDIEANSKDNFGQTPLARAAGEGREAVVKLLLARSDVRANSKDPRGRTPLSWAAKEGREAVVKLLLERNDVEADSREPYFGRTPLSLAAREGHEAVVKLLLARKDADTNSKGNFGQTPLLLAAKEEHEVVKLLQSDSTLNRDGNVRYSAIQNFGKHQPPAIIIFIIDVQISPANVP